MHRIALFICSLFFVLLSVSPSNAATFKGTVKVDPYSLPSADLDWHYEDGDTCYITIGEPSYIDLLSNDGESSMYNVSIPFTFSINGHVFSGPDIIFDTAEIRNSGSDLFSFSDNGDQPFGNAMVDEAHFTLTDSTGTAFSSLDYPYGLDFSKFDSMEFLLFGDYFRDGFAYCGVFSADMQVVATPAPATIILFATGLLICVARRRLFKDTVIPPLGSCG